MLHFNKLFNQTYLTCNYMAMLVYKPKQCEY